METAVRENQFALVDPNAKLKDLLESRTDLQRKYFTQLALGASRLEARRDAGVSDTSVDNWGKDLAFIEIEEIIESTNKFRDEAFTLFVGDNLPSVLVELMTIIKGNGKDKEKAIEFFLKDMSSITHKGGKGKGGYEEMLVRIRRKAVDAVDSEG